MYQSTFRREGFIIHPLGKNLKWDKICSHLASQAIYMGIGLENDSQHGFNFFSKKSIFRADNANMINRNAGIMYQSTFKREGFIIHSLEKNLKWYEIWSYVEKIIQTSKNYSRLEKLNVR